MSVFENLQVFDKKHTQNQQKLCWMMNYSILF